MAGGARGGLAWGAAAVTRAPATSAVSNSRALHAESSGNGPPLVFWHGWAANLRVFDGLRAALAGHWRTMAIDLPGHGRSPRVEGTQAADPEAIPAQKVAALLAPKPGRATLIAWSFG